MDVNVVSSIPPLEHTYKSVTYTCAGQGLLKDGFGYDAHPEKFFPPRPSKSQKAGAASEPPQAEKKSAAWWKAQCAFRGLNQSGAISDLQLRLKDAKKKMLPELKEVETQLNKEYKKLCKSSKDDSWKALKSVEQKAVKDPHRFLVEAFPKGPTGRPANLDIVVLKIEERAEIALAAEKLGLKTVSVDAPWANNKRPSLNRWIIVGRTRDAVWNQMREIERESLRSKQDTPKEKAKSQPKKPRTPPVMVAETDSIPSSTARKKQTAKRGGAMGMPRVSTPRSNPDPAPRSKQTARRGAPFGMSRVTSPPVKTEAAPRSNPGPVPRSKQTARRGAPFGMSRVTSPPMKTEEAPRSTPRPSVPLTHSIKREAQETQVSQAESKKNVWDVTGIWRIQCPEIEGGWKMHVPLTLKIYLEKIGNSHQMFAEFNFNIIQGVFRFMKPIPVPKSESSNSKKRKWEDEEDEEDEVDMDFYDKYTSDSDTVGPSKYIEKSFHLGTKDKPTARRPTWQYSWRGRETGEGEIQLYTDRQVQAITFSKKGEELSGNFNCDFCGNCEFTGTKMGPLQPAEYFDIEGKWDDEYSEEAHEYERVARWH